MDIKTLQATEYRGYKVYIRNFSNLFEYLVIIRGELYTAHIIIHRTLLQTIFGRPYTKKQLGDTVKYLKNVAEATVDAVTGVTGDKK